MAAGKEAHDGCAAQRFRQVKGFLIAAAGYLHRGAGLRLGEQIHASIRKIDKPRPPVSVAEIAQKSVVENFFPAIVGNGGVRLSSVDGNADVTGFRADSQQDAVAAVSHAQIGILIDILCKFVNVRISVLREVRQEQDVDTAAVIPAGCIQRFLQPGGIRLGNQPCGS